MQSLKNISIFTHTITIMQIYCYINYREFNKRSHRDRYYVNICIKTKLKFSIIV